MNRKNVSWAVFFCRWILGLSFFMAGMWKVFELGAYEHARSSFVEGFRETWIPVWLLWALGYIIPYLEFVAGGFVCLGFRLRESLFALGIILVTVTYGHLLEDPFFDISGHIFSLLVLLVFVLMTPREKDVLTLDYLISNRGHIRRDAFI